MNILLVNDDGIDADGIIELERILNSIANIYVVAPTGNRSVTSHALSLGRPLKIEKRGDKKYACSGYPADCIRMALNHLFEDVKFDWIISGINNGANLAQDVFYSGTVAAAREGTFDGIKSIAISTVLDDFKDGDHIYYETAGEIVKTVLASTDLSQVDPPCELLNINVPNIPIDEVVEIQRTKLGWREYSKCMDVKSQEGVEELYIGGFYKSCSKKEGDDTLAVCLNKVSLTTIKMLEL